MPLAPRSGRKQPSETIVEPPAAKSILVGLEANENEAIHKGKYHVGE